MDESGSDLAEEFWGGGLPIASSVLVFAEGRAALAAALRTKRLTATQHTRALANFEARAGELISVDVDEHLARRAGEQDEKLGLRGYDSVHLATALELHDEVAMITWDADLRRAAEEAGLHVASNAY